MSFKFILFKKKIDTEKIVEFLDEHQDVDIKKYQAERIKTKK